MFLELEHIEVRVCRCRLAAKQLVQQGLFPCAPLYPTLAVDMCVLQLVSGLFLRISPNNTTVSGTVEEFLQARGYQMQGEVWILPDFS